MLLKEKLQHSQFLAVVVFHFLTSSTFHSQQEEDGWLKTHWNIVFSA